MQFLLNFLGSLLAKETLKLPFKIMLIGLIVSGYVAFFNFILVVLNKFYSFFNDFDSLSNRNEVFVLFVKFLNASGLGEAVYVSANLFVYLFGSYMGVRVTLILIDSIKKILDTI